MWCARIALFCIALLLGGCATVRQVDSQVQTLSTLKSLPVAGYRFERLPSQQSAEQTQNQAALEAMAERALTLVGLKRDDARPGYSLLIGASVQRDLRAGWDDPWYGPGRLSFGFGVSRGGRLGYGTSVYAGTGFPRYSTPLVRREISLVMRDLGTGQVVYETHALHESPWLDSENILPLMFQAALSGFPVPPAERRVVNIALPPPDEGKGKAKP